MARGQNSAAVFDGNADHFAAEVGGYPQFITNSCGEQVARAHLAVVPIAAHTFYRIVAGTVSAFHFLIVKPAIAGNSINSRHAARVYTGMPATGYGGCVWNECIIAGKPLTQ